MGLKFEFFATPAASLHHCIPINWWMRLTTKRSRRLKRCNSAKGRSSASTLMQSTVQPTTQADAFSWKAFCTSFYITARFCKIFPAPYSPPFQRTDGALIEDCPSPMPRSSKDVAFASEKKCKKSLIFLVVVFCILYSCICKLSTWFIAIG